MKLLRDDLVIYPAEDGSKKFFVKNPSTDALYEFGEKEYYLISALKSPYHERVLLTKFNAKFGEKETLEYVSDLIAMFDEWGLLKENSQHDVGEKRSSETSPQVTPPPQLNKRKRLNHWSIFPPQKLLDGLLRYVGFIRFFDKLILVLLAVALVTLFSNIHLFKQDLSKISAKFTLFEHLLFTMFTLNLFTQIVKGCVARHFNVSTPSFGFLLAFGIIPRFDIRVDMDKNVSRKAKLWLTSSPFWVRFVLFELGIMLWFLTRPMGTSLSILCGAVALFSMFTLFFVANPLLSSDGYRLVTIYYNMPNIREKAVRSVRNLFFPPPGVIAKYSDDRLALKIYGSLSLLFIISVVVFVGFSIGHWLEEHYRGLGVFVFVVIVVYIFFRYRYLSMARKKMRTGNEPLSDKTHDNLSKDQKRYMSSTMISAAIGKVRWLRCFVIAIAVAALFLPYRYEAGGSADVLPVLHQKIYAETKGIVKTVYYNGGEWLKKGTLIAEMENYRQEKDVALARHFIDKKREEINILLTTPTEEEVALAKQQLLTSKLKLKYSKDDYKRAQTLYNTEVIPLANYLDARERMDLDQQEAREKEANLLFVKNQVNPHKIESAKLELVILQRELQFFIEQLERTRLRMPNDGKIITMNLKNLEKKYLDDGQFFAEVENASHVQIEIKIPESDAGQINVGDNVQFKTQLYPNKSMNGSVTSIYPVTEETNVGTVLKVVSVIPNENYVLKTGMTGYAKIEGDEMIVIQAFTRALISFCLIEFWSWLP